MASIKIAAFTCNTSGARQNIVPSGGPGTNPKAAIFIVSGATALDTLTSPARVSIGMTDGTTQLVNSLMEEDNNVLTVTSADTGNRFDNTMVISTCLTTAETIDSEANFVAWTNDGVAINWVDFPASALRGHVIFFYGSDLSADVVSFTPSATSNTEVIQTGLSFAPDALIGLSSWNAHSDGGSGASARMSIGFATNYGGSIQQASRTHFDQDRNTGTSSIHRTNRFLSRLTATAETASFEVTSFTSDGFGITTRGGSLGSPCAILALKVDGARSRVVSTIIDTTGANQKYVESFGFKPKTALFLGGGATASNTLSTTQDNGAFLGAAVSTSEEFSTSWLDQNHSTGTDINDTYSLTSSSGAIGFPNAAGTINYAGSLTAFTHNGINFEIVDAGVDAYVMSFLAFEDETARIGAETEQISDAFRLLVTIDRLSQDEVEQIADSFVFKTESTDQALVADEAELLSDAFAFHTTDRKVFDDTEEISDAFRLVVTSDMRALSDTEQIADATLFVVTGDSRSISDTEQISDAFNFIVGKFLVADDTVEIGDGFVMVSTGTTFLISNDTEQISDGFVTVLGGVSGLTFVPSETVQLSDGVVMIAGQVLVSGDTEAISDAFNSGRGLIARKAIKRGRVF